MAIQLTTLGGLHAFADAGELDWLLSQRLRAALFVYLAVEQQTSREALSAVFWPESDTENARHALRQCLYQLRQALGAKWLEAHTHELRVLPHVQTDAHHFVATLDRGDAEAAARLYQGAFLDGVHLVDVQPWESWVDARRAQYARTFRKACREWLDAKRAAGDTAGAILAAEWWVGREPSDDEAQHRLIQTLADAGERADAIRQYEAYARLLQIDGLRPFAETEALVARLRADTVLLPALSDVPASAAPLLEAATATPKSRRSRVLLSMTIALAVVIAVAWGFGRRYGANAPVESSTALAVLPFSVHGGNDALYLADAMVNLLAAALDGAASVRPVDTRAVHAAVAQAGGTSADRARGSRVAARLGAGLYVLGDVVQANDKLQIEAAIYERDRSATPRARAVVSGAVNELFDLVDQLAARLLAGLGDASADRLLRSAAVTTTSLAAFKAYLEGETLMRGGEFERAADAYLSAIAVDSAFGLAHYRLALAREWAPLPGNEEAASAAARYADRLSPRDRSLLDAHRAWRSGDAAAAERAFRAIVARYPHDIEAWLQLGEVLFHHGPLSGRPISDSEAAWRKALSYEPRNLFAVPHLVRIAAASGRVSATDSLLRSFSPDEMRTDRRLVEIVLLRALAANDTAAALAVVDRMRQWEDFSVWRVAVFATAFSPEPALTARVIAKLIDNKQRPAIRADLHWFTSILQLASGRAGSARVALADAVDVESSVDPQWRRGGFGATTEWYAATLPLPHADSTLARVRRNAASPSETTGNASSVFANELGLGQSLRFEPLRLYTLGVVSLRLKDLASAHNAAEGLRRFARSADASALDRDLDRGLQAQLAAFEGRAEEGLKLLEALELRDVQGDVAVTPFASRANERFLHGELLVALGRDAEALQWFASIGSGSVSEIPLRAPAHLRQAEIHERLGNRAEAAGHHAKAVELWSDADDEFQPLAETARRRLARLSRAR